MWNQLHNAGAFSRWEIELHVGCVLLELSEQVFIWSANDVVNFVHLVQFIVAWEKREQRNYLEQHAADAPNVHFVPVIAVS